MQRNERDIADAAVLLNYDKCKGPLTDSRRGTTKEVLHQKKGGQLRREVELAPEFRQHATNLLPTLLIALE